MQPFADLPHEPPICTIVREQITANAGAISFADYMQTVLYHQQFGYYQHLVLGRAGDFITAPELSPLFAQCFVQQVVDILQRTALTPQILELGAGSGKFCGDFLSAFVKNHHSEIKYFIYEPCQQLRLRQQQLLTLQFPQWVSKIQWLTSLPSEFEGIVIANEVLDALPVHCFRINGRGYIEERTVKNENTCFLWHPTAPLSDALERAAANLMNKYHLSPWYASEINLHLAPFLLDLALSIKKGVVLIADYGYGEREYYHPQRHTGTLTCFYKHQQSQNPFLLPGSQDISAHVNFTQLVSLAVEMGFTLLGFTTQAGFLLDCHLLQLAAEMTSHCDPVTGFELQQAIKILTFPTEMGERIKVMALSKEVHGVDTALQGFTSVNRLREL